MARETILQEQELEFTIAQILGTYCYAHNITEVLNLSLSGNCIVVWDGEEYDCTVVDASSLMPDTLAFGNLSAVGLSGGNENAPFVVGFNSEGAFLVSTIDTEVTTHTVAIYQDVADVDENTVLAETTLGFAESGDGLGLYLWSDSTVFVLTLGEIYQVFWDGVEYICTAEEMTMGIISGIGLGNKNIVGIGEDTGEPFILAYLPDYSSNGCYTADTSESHMVAIYKYEEPNGIVIRDPLGRSITYGEYKKILLNRANGEKTIYSEGDAQETSISLDFSNGNMSIKPDDGELFSKVNISKPSALLANNIKKDVEIAGIVGTLTSEKQEKTVTLSLADGNQDVLPDDGYLLSKVTIEKPDALLSENIKSGVNIAGVDGEYTGDGIENVEINLDFADGDQNFSAEDEALMKSVLIKKPTYLLPEYIADGVEIAGVVGEFKGGGGDNIFDSTDVNLRYFAYQLDVNNQLIIIRAILHEIYYADKGTYDVEIPDMLGGYHVVINSEGVD